MLQLDSILGPSKEDGKAVMHPSDDNWFDALANTNPALATPPLSAEMAISRGLKNKKSVIFSGMLGSGKTTLLKKLQEKVSCHIIQNEGAGAVDARAADGQSLVNPNHRGKNGCLAVFHYTHGTD